MKNNKCTLEYGKITENVDHEKYTLQDIKYGEKNWKRWKIQKCPLQDLEYGEKTENHENENETRQVVKYDEIY